ncbi:MAG TPA: transglutaminase-like domain-containing protein [Streptosporangiaceae bacterium]
MEPEIDYAEPGPLTGLEGLAPEILEGVGNDPIQACLPVHLLVVQPDAARELGLEETRLSESSLRPAARILGALLALNPAPVGTSRPPNQRVVGTCRHFALLSCAFLRYWGIAARVRCGFATYFQAGQGLDHWITEYRNGDGRWVRVDPEILGGTVLDHPEELRPGEFMSGGEAWAAFRRGEIDAARFGVYGTGNWGPAEIRGNAVKDLAALNKVEMLPWDEWGRMSAAYRGETGDDYDELLDELAAVCAADDPAAVASLYAHDDLRVPAEIIG